MMPDIGDIVEIIRDIPEKNLCAGEQGTIVHRHEDSAYEVEFTDEDGETLDFFALHAEDFIVIWQAETRRWISAAERISFLVAALPEEDIKQLFNFARFLFSQNSRRSINHVKHVSAQ